VIDLSAAAGDDTAEDGDSLTVVGATLSEADFMFTA